MNANRPASLQYKTAECDKVPNKIKVIYGIGGVSENLMANAVHQLANPIFNIMLGINPAFIGAVLAAGRLIDAFVDPIVGNFSDNFRSRFGRRRPLMMLGAVVAGLAFWLMFMFPRGLGGTACLVWFSAFSLIYFPAFALYSIPKGALGIELTRDYHERTRLQGVAALLVPVGGIAAVWLFAITKLDIFPDSIAGARWTGFAFFVLVSLIALYVVHSIKETGAVTVARQRKIAFRESLALTVKCRPLLLLGGATCFILLAFFTVYSLGLYVNIYHVHGGNEKTAAILHGAISTAYQIASIAGAPLISLLALRFGKKNTLIGSLFLVLAGTLSKWACFTPSAPWLMFVPMILMGAGMSGFWVLLSAMVADVCDYDELKNGYRREAMIGAVLSWVSKMGGSVAYFISGLVLVVTGFNKDLGGAQAPETILWMRILFSFFPVMFICLAIGCVLRFPITAETAYATRKAIAEREAARQDGDDRVQKNPE
ncbi:MAG: MFS transporter [Opitutaceae bacterium]|jgi:GPH family glycoside/pentoside/hexuronide:cation symporter|nr:MFS transporter [Opitutaceae bacterium]